MFEVATVGGRRNGLCECGCGRTTRIASSTSASEGRVKGRPMRFIHGHNGGGPLRTRLLSRLVVDPSGCLLWTGHTTEDGYGQIMADGIIQPVHRVMWELFEGPIPDGLHLDHVRDRGCRNRNCASIAHLEPVTPRENILRGATLPAANAAKTHCPQGHPYDAENTFVNNRGERQCRICHRETWQRSAAKRKAARSQVPPDTEVSNF